MGTSPAAPRPPEPPRSSHWVAITLLSLALIVVVSGITILLGLRFLSNTFNLSVHDTGKGVDIKTPVGSLDVRKEVSEAQLGLPIYPGSTRIHEGDGGATISLGLPQHDNVRIVAARSLVPLAAHAFVRAIELLMNGCVWFATSLSVGVSLGSMLDKVRDFYKQQLGSQVTKFTEKNSEGKAVFEIKRQKDQKIVALKPGWGSTEIALVRILESGGETN